MSDKNANFAMEIRPASGGPKNGFKAEARLGSGDFKELGLRFKRPNDPKFYNFNLFDSEGTSTTCTVSPEDVRRLPEEKLKFSAIARFEVGDPQTSNEVEVDLT